MGNLMVPYHELPDQRLQEGKEKSKGRTIRNHGRGVGGGGVTIPKNKFLQRKIAKKKKFLQGVHHPKKIGDSLKISRRPERLALY